MKPINTSQIDEKPLNLDLKIITQTLNCAKNNNASVALSVVQHSLHIKAVNLS